MTRPPLPPFIAVRFAYGSRDGSGTWSRSCGDGNGESTENVLIRRRYAGIDRPPITPDERLSPWPRGRRPDDRPGPSEPGR